MNKVFDTVWSYDEDNKRFIYDCKLYLKDQKLYYLDTDEFCRELDKEEKEKIYIYMATIKDERNPIDYNILQRIELLKKKCSKFEIKYDYSSNDIFKWKIDLAFNGNEISINSITLNSLLKMLGSYYYLKIEEETKEHS